MNYVLANRQGLSAIELIVALAVASVFLMGVITAFSQIITTTNDMERRMDAMQSGRAALEMISRDVMMARYDPYNPGERAFRGHGAPLSYGDGIDQDGDGNVDEELLDGRDDDNDWQVGSHDNHSFIGGVFERPLWVNKPDLGDWQVDEDCRFEHDILSFPLSAEWSGDPPGLRRYVTYEITDFEGEQHVLMRHVIRYDGSYLDTTSMPVAFRVFSFACLYWDANGDPPYWTTEWDSGQAFNFSSPGIELPAAVYLQLVMYAEEKPIENYEPGDPIETVTLSLSANVESVLNDSRYRKQ